MLQSRNESASESDIFMRKLQEFGKVDRIEFVSGEKIDLNESPLVLTPFSPKLTLAAELVLSTQIQTWHLILVSIRKDRCWFYTHQNSNFLHRFIVRENFRKRTF